MKVKRPDLSQSDLIKMFSYDEKTGVFVWKSHYWTRLIGEEAGCVGDGYIIITIKGVPYYGHRLAWFYVYGEWPSGHIDHVNTIRGDNSIKNLRLASHQGNGANAKISKNNTSGFKGVCFESGRTKPWRSSIFYDGKSYYLGHSSTPEEAHAIYVAAAKKHFGEFARAG